MMAASSDCTRRADVLDEQDDPAHRARRLIPGLHFPAQPDRRAVGARHELLLDLGRLAGQAALVGGTPLGFCSG